MRCVAWLEQRNRLTIDQPRSKIIRGFDERHQLTVAEDFFTRCTIDGVHIYVAIILRLQQRTIHQEVDLPLRQYMHYLTRDFELATLIDILTATLAEHQHIARVAPGTYHFTSFVKRNLHTEHFVAVIQIFGSGFDMEQVAACMCKNGNRLGIGQSGSSEGAHPRHVILCPQQ